MREGNGMRLIDADKIDYLYPIDVDGQEHDGITLKSIIDEMPTIEERKKGKWINAIDNDYARCSICGCHYQWSLIEEININYCPYCGARMGVQDETD